MENMVIGITLLIVGVLNICEAVFINILFINTEERLENLEVASAGYGEIIPHLFEKVRKLEENA